MRCKLCLLLILLFFLPAALLAAEQEKEVQFSRDIRSILSNHCFHCHGPSEEDREADLRLDNEQDAKADRDGSPAVKPGDLEGSVLWQRIITKDPDQRMPPPEINKDLTAGQIETLRRWIEQGAKWQGHWSFIRPTKPQPPKPVKKGETTNPIDNFILARLHQEGLQPSPEAAHELLIRRVTFDLIGLPPTLRQIDDFVNDQEENAFEKVVDRLLADKRFGERMTLAWLDAARYGDTSVFHADGPRDMWAWRDWVIDAYNTNMPFDQFTVEQLAGDLIPNATLSQQIASAFNRNHGTTDEGGAIAEEYRVEYIVDRVKTTSNIWLGLTMECSQCHEHKYDPISQKEYYQFYAYFNRSADKGMQTRNGNAEPRIAVPKPGSKEKITKLESRIAEVQKEIDAHIMTIGPQFAAWQKQKSTEKIELPGDMSAHFTLDEMKGDQVGDAVDPSRSGKIHGKPKWTSGKINGALKTDSKTYVDLGDVADFERDESFTYGAWIHATGNRSGSPIARMDDGSAYRGYDLYLVGGKVAVHLVHQWPGNAVKVTTKSTLAKDKAQHVMVTYDGSSKAAGIKIYIDGKPQDWVIEQDGLTKTIRTNKPLYLGRRNPGSPFTGTIDDVRIYRRQLSETEVLALAGADPVAPILAVAENKRTDQQKATLQQHYLQMSDKKYQKLSGSVADWKKEIEEQKKPLTSVMVMRDMEKPRMTYVLKRGHYASPNKDEVIKPGVPAFLPPLAKDAPDNRLGLARWLVDPSNPLVSRVAVNRYWQMLFGTGIVETAADFGSQGQWPSHPRLLDYLATDFVESGWDVKRIIKQMVMSSTYRQSSRATPELLEKDLRNRLLARGPRFRLQGEFIRDAALDVSGLLVDKIGGPSVKPYQPKGLWNEVSLNGGLFFKQDHGEKLYRRSMYIYWKRSAPPPSMRIFDAPTREKCEVSRARTNTPLQAFVTLNDPQFVEAARFLAERIMIESDSAENRIETAYRLVTGRRPKLKVGKVLLNIQQQQLERFQKDNDAAESLLSIGEKKRNEKLDAAEHASWTIVTSMILNLDEFLTRG